MPRSSDSTEPVPVVRQRAIGVLTAVLLVLLATFLLRGGSPVATTAPGATATPAETAVPASADTVALGKRLYATNCAGCHGANLEGAPGGGPDAAPPLNASGPARQRSDTWLFTTIRDGGQATAPPGTTSFMPAMGGSLSDAEIRAIIAYLRQVWAGAAPVSTSTTDGR
ncbi:MAG TPA: cytochrome c [Herpetosiphonaceae bacterium]|nr:cytochrome c [Herpetosiphonaceae bacterium]